MAAVAEAWCAPCEALEGTCTSKLDVPVVPGWTVRGKLEDGSEKVPISVVRVMVVTRMATLPEFVNVLVRVNVPPG